MLAQFAHKFLCLFAILTVLPFAAARNGQRTVAGFSADFVCRAGQSPTLCISWFFISQDILWFLIHLGAIWVRCVTKQISMAGFKYQKIFVYTAGIPPYVCQLACSLSLYFKEKWSEGLHVLFLYSFACGVVKSPSLFLTRPITLAEGGIFQRKIAPTNDTETTLWHKSKLAKWFGILYFTWAMSMQLFP